MIVINIILIYFFFTQVHSANSWESADLGDNERNSKFLRLMGAKKVNMLKYAFNEAHQ